ncbi:MAG: hypothetical protein ACI909_000609 [Planctomycetota bacterium]|jgi:hypothetical protein
MKYYSYLLCPVLMVFSQMLHSHPFHGEGEVVLHGYSIGLIEAILILPVIIGLLRMLVVHNRRREEVCKKTKDENR